MEEQRIQIHTGVLTITLHDESAGFTKSDLHSIEKLFLEEKNFSTMRYESMRSKKMPRN